jgi:multiple sugar transport system substrate-binding protein
MIRFSMPLVLCLVAALAGCSTQGAEKGKTVISYTRWGDPNELESTRKIIQQFMDENPDIVVRVDVVSWGQYWQKMATAAVTGTAQDVWLMSPAYVEQYAGGGHILDLKPLMLAEKTFSLDDYFPHPFDAFCFTGDARDLRHAKFDDPGAKVYAFTRDYNCGLLYYNRDFFDAIGLAYPDETWGWDDFVAAAKKLTIDFDGDGTIDRWGLAGLNYGSLAGTNGARRMDVENLRSTASSDPEYVGAIRFCYDLIYKYKVTPPPSIQLESDAFTTGKAAMAVNGVWEICRYNHSKYLWGIARVPTRERGGHRMSSAGGMGHAIYAKTQHLDAAWRLVKFLSGEISQRELGKSGTSVPVLKKAAFSEDFLSPFDRPPKESYEVIFKSLSGDYVPSQYTRGYIEYTDYEARMIQGVWAGLRTPEEACRLIDEETNRILDREYGSPPAPAPSKEAPGPGGGR